MQFTENGITFHFDMGTNRFAPESNSILGGNSFSFNVTVNPVQLNTFLEITFFEGAIEYIPEISSLQIDKSSGVGIFAVKTHKIATKGVLTLKLSCVTGKQRVKKTLTFNLVSKFLKQRSKEISPKIENTNVSSKKISQPTQGTEKAPKKSDPFSITLPDLIQLATNVQKEKTKEEPRYLLNGDKRPSQLLDNPVMENASFETPVFLIPCQIETRVFPELLKIRIYPDQIAIDSLE